MDVRTILRTRRLASLVAVVAFSLAVAGVVVAAGPAIQTFTPHSADQVTNIDVLRQQIRNYYGDPLREGTGPGVVATTATTPRRRGPSPRTGRTGWRRAPTRTAVGDQGDRPRRGRHDVGHLELRDLQQLGLQPDDERHVRQRPAVPGGARHGGDGERRPLRRGTRSSSSRAGPPPRRRPRWAT